jgi:hypothetical protein
LDIGENEGSMKYLRFYEECMRAGRMPKSGLCSSIMAQELRELFQPESVQWYDYWASEDWGEDTFVFNETRQTIVLLLAAMNGEL